MNTNKSCHSRRQFMGLVGAGYAGVMIQGSMKPVPAAVKILNQQEGMAYRRLGQTELMVSEVCFGGSPAPVERVLHEAIERGVNYIDTSSVYQNGNSELIIGKCIKGRRDEIIITTKFHPSKAETADDLIKEAEGSLKRLGVDHVDMMLVHQVRSPEQAAEEKVLSAFERLKKDGKIRFMGVSVHRNVMDILPKIIKTDKYSMAMINYNSYSSVYKNKKPSEDLYADSGFNTLFDMAQKHDMGIIAMKVQGGGNNQKLDKFLTGDTTAAQAKIKWALSRPEVASVCSRMTNVEHLRENLGAIDQKLSMSEEGALKEYCLADSEETCRMCGACEKVCVRGLKISDILRYRMYAYNYGELHLARQKYARLPNKNSFTSCTDCGRCETACPFGVDIRQGIRTAHEMLA
ncbi:aldo/keto reductase [Verrucomicrobiota bacterium]